MWITARKWLVTYIKLHFCRNRSECRLKEGNSHPNQREQRTLKPHLWAGKWRINSKQCNNLYVWFSNENTRLWKKVCHYFCHQNRNARAGDRFLYLSTYSFSLLTSIYNTADHVPPVKIYWIACSIENVMQILRSIWRSYVNICSTRSLFLIKQTHTVNCFLFF